MPAHLTPFQRTLVSAHAVRAWIILAWDELGIRSVESFRQVHGGRDLPLLLASLAASTRPVGVSNETLVSQVKSAIQVSHRVNVGRDDPGPTWAGDPSPAEGSEVTQDISMRMQINSERTHQETRALAMMARMGASNRYQLTIIHMRQTYNDTQQRMIVSKGKLSAGRMKQHIDVLTKFELWCLVTQNQSAWQGGVGGGMDMAMATKFASAAYEDLIAKDEYRTMIGDPSKRPGARWASSFRAALSYAHSALGLVGVNPSCPFLEAIANKCFIDLGRLPEQADPPSHLALVYLEKLVLGFSRQATQLDRYFAGCMMILVYAQLRFADLQHLTADALKQLGDAKVRGWKTKVGWFDRRWVGVSRDNYLVHPWLDEWKMLIPDGTRDHAVPTPDKHRVAWQKTVPGGQPWEVQRPLSTQEAAIWNAKLYSFDFAYDILPEEEVERLKNSKSVHCYKRLWISLAASAGYDSNAIQDVVGHASADMTAAYVDKTSSFSEDMKAGVNRHVVSLLDGQHVQIPQKENRQVPGPPGKATGKVRVISPHAPTADLGFETDDRQLTRKSFATMLTEEDMLVPWRGSPANDYIAQLKKEALERERSGVHQVEAKKLAETASKTSRALRKKLKKPKLKALGLTGRRAQELLLKYYTSPTPVASRAVADSISKTPAATIARAIARNETKKGQLPDWLLNPPDEKENQDPSIAKKEARAAAFPTQAERDWLALRSSALFSGEPQDYRITDEDLLELL